ncbi:PAP2 superfamily protein [Kribbella antiqua]|uniref:PAP2 superfamily protein n=1 Tax=Kribbella antiqua TaxID=2512217 RepID=A0A4R2J824_9ACTN|nr:phosphatase PAP2 family protein [Kribbella antiqua]TCO52069.1 PAP2 superfamily protein [Kribbella antiqua]
MATERFTKAHLLAVASTVAFLALAAIVATGLTQGLDDRLRQVFRPNDVWGNPWQVILGPVTDGLAPPFALGLLAVAGIIAAIRRKSRRPVVYVAVLAVVAVLITQVSKAILQRPDPHGHVGMLSGSYPSGHMVILLVVLGGAALVLWEKPPRWVWWLIVVAELTMGLSLLVLTMHWFTDVVGGGLLAVPVVVFANSPRFLGPVHRTARPTAVDPVGSPT